MGDPAPGDPITAIEQPRRGRPQYPTMSEATEKTIRLSKVLKEFNLAMHTVVEFLGKSGHVVESNPNAKIDGASYELLLAQFGTDKAMKAQSQQVVNSAMNANPFPSPAHPPSRK